jgi:methionine synthase II (cobalamin-independent)
MPLNREQFFEIFDKLISTIREHDETPVGLHCCGNSDWDIILQSKIDILSFDAFDYGKYFVLYPERIRKFLERGGIIAWGAVPTSEYNSAVTIDVIVNRLNSVIDELTSKGIKKDLILRRSIFTPACGMGSLDVDIAERIIDLTCELAEKMQTV